MNNNNKEKYKLNNSSSQLSDSFTASTKTNSTPKSNSDMQISFNSDKDKNAAQPPKVNISNRAIEYIKEVYADNFFEELKVISELIEEYNYIGMDTEFPGTVYNLNNITNDFYYKTLKINVDSLKLIQLGITLSNEKGEYPKNITYHTWQFNFQFDLMKDAYNEESVKLLKNSGINFEKLKKNGIKHRDFAENIITSGLVLNPDIYWISYHGAYDFAYILKLLTNERIPMNEEEFIDILSLYFHNYYDVKMLVKDLEYYFNGGLNKLIYKLGVIRKGVMHQAGSDSIATIESFLSLKKYKIVSEERLTKYKNVLYGIGIGQDNENTILYTKCLNNNIDIQNIQTNVNNVNNNKNYFPNLKQQQITNNCSNKNIKWFCPIVLVNANAYGMMNRNPLLNNLNGMNSPIEITA